jgi:hypothetical protein
VSGCDVGGQADGVEALARTLAHCNGDFFSDGDDNDRQVYIGIARAFLTSDWLAAHAAQRVADAKAEAWDEGYLDGWEFDGTLGYAPTNPYREANARTTPPTTGRADGQEGGW